MVFTIFSSKHLSTKNCSMLQEVKSCKELTDLGAIGIRISHV